MADLAHSHCVPCRSSEPALSAAASTELLKAVPGWTLVEREGIARLERRYAFGNFLEALDFTNRVGREAQDEDHHPALLTEWGAVTVSWWTHNIGGLHRNDFIMAARTDAVALAASV